MTDIAPQPMHFYRSSREAGTPKLRSPDYVQLSTAAAITFGIIPGRMYRTECTHCLNLLVTYPEGCRANCAYCGLARHREEARDYADRNFIRVDWPIVPFEDIITRMKRGGDGGAFQRMCISMITHPDSDADTLVLLERWAREVPGIPVSILSNPTTLQHADLVQMRDLGADIFTVALDAATPPLFERTRGKTVQSPHRWDTYWQCIEWAADVFGPEHFGVHLICGMGETEQEILAVVQRVRDRGGHSHMFAFYPEQGSLMEDWGAVSRDQWRRVQLGRYLIDYGGVRLDEMAFDAAGRVVDFGIVSAQLDAVIDSGAPFRTSGCPGSGAKDVSACNRPYGDSCPSDIYSFPFALDHTDVGIVRRQLSGEDIATAAVDENKF
ncbi:MAG: radical SAM protein [Gammaproteobacteria bacterium SG8_47]|nr:MAG: radical SAM protein [Gammaproteobacteria bacterium SG8_47]